VLTIPIADDRPHGIFDRIPEGMDGHGYVTQLLNAAHTNFGHAMPKFIKKPVKAAAKDRDTVIEQINRHIAHFRKRAGVDVNNGAEVRVADAFGLVYAAGRLAKDYEVLPSYLTVLPLHWHAIGSIGLITGTCRLLQSNFRQSGTAFGHSSTTTPLFGLRLRGSHRRGLPTLSLKPTSFVAAAKAKTSCGYAHLQSIRFFRTGQCKRIAMWSSACWCVTARS